MSQRKQLIKSTITHLNDDEDDENINDTETVTTPTATSSSASSSSSSNEDQFSNDYEDRPSTSNNQSSCPFAKISKFIRKNRNNNNNNNNNNNKNDKKYEFNNKSKYFNILLNSIERYSTIFKERSFKLKHKKFKNLLKLFEKSESYYTTMLLFNENTNLLGYNRLDIQDIDEITNNFNKVEKLDFKSIKNQFYQCYLCKHILHEPITLICGCTQCKNCLNEYNHAQICRNLKRQQRSNRLFRHQYHQQMNNFLFKCNQCDNKHDHNTSDYLKQNILIMKFMEKLFQNQIDTRILRSDLRKYICNFKNSIEVNTAIRLFEFAFNLDHTNHLLLADLFLLNYFNGSYNKCIELAELAIGLVPEWPFAYFMRSLCKTRIAEIKTDLLNCIELDPNLDRIQLFLHNLSNYDNADDNQINEVKKNLNNNLADCLKNENENKNIAIKRTKEIKGNEIEDCSPPIESKCKKFHANSNQTDDKISNENDDCAESNSLESSLSTESTINSIKDTTTVRLKYDLNSVKIGDLECILCYRVFYNAVSTTCGHVFCCACLDRSLDHHDKCPLCKSSLTDYLAERRQFVTKSVDDLIQLAFPNEYADRKRQYDDEMLELTKDPSEIPIFVCTLSLPTIQCPLHIFEPRYRLMLRRALSTTKQFGMCVYTENSANSYANYGCMLEITKAQFLRDGRAIIETVGGRRFKVLERSMKDGYNVARVEWIKDSEIANDEEKKHLRILEEDVYKSACKWFDHLPVEQKAKIYQYFGASQMPSMQDNEVHSDYGPKWHWFLINILPLENEFQLKFLGTSSLLARLLQLKRILHILLNQFERDNSQKKNETSNKTQTTAQ